MIRHDDIMIERQPFVVLLDFQQRVTNAHARRGESRLRDVEDAVPYNDVGQNASSVLRADGDEIGAGGGIIVRLQSDSFPLRQIHGHAFPSFVGAATCRP